LNTVCEKNSCLIHFVQSRIKRHKIALSSVAILADLLLNLAGLFSGVKFSI